MFIMFTFGDKESETWALLDLKKFTTFALERESFASSAT